MELSDLFSRGTALKDVPPEFRGMPGKEWLKKDLSAQSEAYRAKMARQGFDPPLNKKPIAKPKPDFGGALDL